MTVKELKKVLDQHPDDMSVLIDSPKELFNIGEIRQQVRQDDSITEDKWETFLLLLADYEI